MTQSHRNRNLIVEVRNPIIDIDQHQIRRQITKNSRKIEIHRNMTIIIRRTVRNLHELLIRIIEQINLVYQHRRTNQIMDLNEHEVI